MQALIHHISQKLSAHFQQHIEVKKLQQVFGGDINQTFQLQTNAGSFFLKLNDGVSKDMFEKEFDGLRLLYSTNTIRIPKPLLCGSFENNIFLITEFINKGYASKSFWKIFAQQLAALHKHSQPQFGLKSNNYIGSLLQQNTFCNTWADFYSNYRIMPLMQKALSNNKCGKEDVLLAEKLCSRFNDLFPSESPALVHGDLWSGNYMSNENGDPVIYDPAVYYGNREMDIAMSLLFGGFDKTFYILYNEVLPLQPNWKERTQLYQLYPLLVHLNLFGGHYYQSVMNIIKAYT
jgi:fructosamine-3-kinase